MLIFKNRGKRSLEKRFLREYTIFFYLLFFLRCLLLCEFFFAHGSWMQLEPWNSYSVVVLALKCMKEYYLIIIIIKYIHYLISAIDLYNSPNMFFYFFIAVTCLFNLDKLACIGCHCFSSNKNHRSWLWCGSNLSPARVNVGIFQEGSIQSMFEWKLKVIS